MKKLICKFSIVLSIVFGTFGLFSPDVHADWWDDLTNFSDDAECIVDLDIDLDFTGGPDPVFDGPGIKRGAKLVRCDLDSGVSKKKDLKGLIIGWMKFLLSITAVLAVVALVWAGVLYVTAFGDESRTESAKNIILWVVIGILLIFGSYAIVNTVMKARFADEQDRPIIENTTPPPAPIVPNAPDPTLPPPVGGSDFNPLPTDLCECGESPDPTAPVGTSEWNELQEWNSCIRECVGDPAPRIDI